MNGNQDDSDAFADEKLPKEKMRMTYGSVRYMRLLKGSCRRRIEGAPAEGPEGPERFHHSTTLATRSNWNVVLSPWRMGICYYHRCHVPFVHLSTTRTKLYFITCISEGRAGGAFCSPISS